jgi:PAS domain S-box-containing protein
VSEETTRPTTEQHLARFSRMAEEIRGQLATFRSTLGPMAKQFPPGVLEGLRLMSGTLLSVKKWVEENEQERRNLQALAEISQMVNSSLELTTVLNEVMDTIIRLTGAQRAFLMMRNEQGGMDTVVARNWERATLEAGEIEISGTIVQRVISQGEAVLTTNAQADPRFDQQASVVAYNLRSILCVPLKVKGVLTGVIYADNRIREGLFSERERSLLFSFANQAAVALENARLFASVRRTLDEVTELKNLMEDVFASIASGVITADISDLITLCNQAAEAILAIPRETLLGSSLQDLLPLLSPDLPSRVIEVKEADQRYVGLEAHPVLAGRGGHVDLTLSISPLKNAERTTRGVAIVLDDLTEKRRLEAQRRLFERMVSPAVIDQLDPDNLQLGGSRMEITTVFADIRGFTPFAETTEPEVLVSVLNRYLAAAAEAILNEEGTIDKFLGDAVMAWFNAPIPQPDHTLRAVRAALAVQAAVARLHEELEPQFRLSFGVGIHCGEAVLGLVGTEKSLNYTAIGDSVNTAKRLQENAAPGQILISRAASERVVAWVEMREVPPLQVEGKEQPVEVLAVTGMRSGTLPY